MSDTTSTTTTTTEPTLYEQGQQALSDAGEAIQGALGYEKETDAHKAGREAGEAVADTANAAGKAVSDAGKAVADAYDGAVAGANK